MKQHIVLAINPGSTSTKIGLFKESELLLEHSFVHSNAELKQHEGLEKQMVFRKELVLKLLKSKEFDLSDIDVVIGRGGLLKPISSGVYEVNDKMKSDLSSCKYGEHASNLGALMADEIAKQIGVKAYIADPVVVDELQEIARICGVPQIKRRSIVHALNQKAVARRYAKEKGVKYNSLNLIVAHLGGGISVGAHLRGEIIDVNNALDGEGPFSPERAGTIPAGDLITLVLSGEYSECELRRMITGGGGVVAHLGTNDMREVEAEVDKGNRKAKLVLDAMCYNIGKSIGAMAAALEGNVDAILLTGGIAHSKYVCEFIGEMVNFITPISVYPGEDELEALAANAVMVLDGEAKSLEYK